MNFSWAILIGAALVAAAIALSGRFEAIQATDGRTWRIDRLTGATWVCGYNADFAIVYCDRYTGRTSKGEQNTN